MQEHKRFIKKVEKLKSGCWEWQGGKTSKGYGQFTYKNGGRAHRYSYEYFVGKIPKNLTIDHLCKNKTCVNPKHLEAVSMRENVLRSDGISARNAKKTVCIRGHEFTKENTYLRKLKKVALKVRVCIECKREHHRQWKIRKKSSLSLLSDKEETK